MSDADLDDVDLQLLDVLERDSRSTLTEIADGLSISANTVSNRLRRLEDDGVLERYTIDIDVSSAGLSFHYLFHSTVSIVDREALAERAVAIPGVIEVYEMMTGERNLLIEGLGRSQDDITRIAHDLDELGIRVVDETAVRQNWHAPMTYAETVEED